MRDRPDGAGDRHGTTRAGRVLERLQAPADLIDALGPAFRQLVDDSWIFALDPGHWRLGPGRDLGGIPFVAYALPRLPAGLAAVIIGPLVNAPAPDGLIGIELVSGADRIVAQVVRPLAGLEPDGPARFDLPPGADAGVEPLFLRVFARGASCPVRVLEWRRRRWRARLRPETRAFAGFVFTQDGPGRDVRPAAGPPGRPRVLAILPQLIPSALIGVVKPLMALHRSGAIVAEVTLEGLATRRRIARADVVVFCRNTEPAHADGLRTALALGKPTIYELDDNFFEIPESTEGGRYHRAPERLAHLERHLRSAALVRVYSEVLRERASRYSGRVRRVDAAVDWTLVPSVPVRRDPGRVRIVYATSRLQDELASLFLDDLRRILAAYAGRVEVVFWGYHPRELRGHEAVRFREFVADYDRFFARFARAGFDIGLAPLRDDPFHRSKSDNKFREYAACRIAGIYSDAGVYATRVVDGVTGLLVPDAPGAWFAAMARLIEDPTLREAIQEQAFRDARERHTMEQARETWRQQIAEVLTDPLAGRRARPRRRPGAGGSATAEPRGQGRPEMPSAGPEPVRGRAAPRTFSLASRLRWRVRTAGLLLRLRYQLWRTRT
jgi:glycosyltransferase involved in cell wall biosynthesis